MRNFSSKIPSSIHLYSPILPASTQGHLVSMISDASLVAIKQANGSGTTEEIESKKKEVLGRIIGIDNLSVAVTDSKEKLQDAIIKELKREYFFIQYFLGKKKISMFDSL